MFFNHMKKMHEREEQIAEEEVDKMLCEYEPNTLNMDIEEKRKFLNDNNLMIGQIQIDDFTTEYCLYKENKIIAGFSLCKDFDDMTISVMNIFENGEIENDR